MTYPTSIGIDSYGYWTGATSVLGPPTGWVALTPTRPLTFTTNGAGRRGGRALVWTSVASAILGRDHFGNTAYLSWGMALRVGTGGVWPTGQPYLCRFDTTTTGAFSLALVLSDTTPGVIELWKNANNTGTRVKIADSGLFTLGSPGDWHYVEVYITPSATTSSTDAVCQVYVDGTQVINVTGFTYRSTAASCNTRVIPGATSSISTPSNVYVAICDTYIGTGPSSDPVGSRLVGEIANECMFPMGDGRFVDFTPFGDSDNYLCVDENTPDDHSTYVWTDIGLATDYYNVGPQPSGFTGVKYVQPVMRYSPGHTSDVFSGVRTHIIAYQGGGEFQEDVGGVSDSPNYVWKRADMTAGLDYGLNFVFGTPWVLADLLTMQFGFRYVSFTGTNYGLFVTQLAVEVALTNPAVSLHARAYLIGV